ncbi:hypothetical protein As57867_018284, partial [Aphanomyces stellatus]
MNFPKAKFKVPDQDPWPEHWRGIKLDISTFRRAYKHGLLDPLIVAQLDKIGFVWNCLEHRWQLNIESLELYKEKDGDLLIQEKFVVPDKDPTWPVYLWRKKLGNLVHRLRASKNLMSSDRREVLTAMGFVWDAVEDARLLNLKALEIYKTLHGDFLVPINFIIPQNDEWPEALWDKKLGFIVRGFRAAQDSMPENRRAELDAMGFVWNVPVDNWARKIAAFEIFKNQHHHLKIPLKFVVPDQDPAWPSDMWGLKLGIVVNTIRR